MKLNIIFLFLYSTFCIGQKANLFKDLRDNKIYFTVKIGQQIWMAENLNYKAENGCWCYDNDTSNCKKYGRMYNWEAAIKACPDGWHLPSSSEWLQLFEFIDKEKGPFIKHQDEIIQWSNIAYYLKTQQGWYFGKDDTRNGLDLYKFHAYPAGAFNKKNYLWNNSIVQWWTATEINKEEVQNIEIFVQDSDIYIKDSTKDSRLSVRCLKN